MRDAFGGLVNIQLILVFIVLVAGFLAFNINYNKAFKVKNYIIKSIEEYNGNCFDGDSQCVAQINQYMNDIGYSVPPLSETDYTCIGGGSNSTPGGFCYRETIVDTHGEIEDEQSESVYYSVLTSMTIDIPLINRILPSIFKVTGDTKIIQK